MTTITISDETAEQLFKDILVQDYLAMVESVNELTALAIQEDLPSYKIEDLNNDRTFRDAMAVLLTYYLTYDEYSKILVDTPA